MVASIFLPHSPQTQVNQSTHELDDRQVRVSIVTHFFDRLLKNVAQSQAVDTPQVEGENTENTAVLQDNDERISDQVDEATDEGCFDIFGICWYWWAIAAGVAGTIWTYFYVTKKTEE